MKLIIRFEGNLNTNNNIKNIFRVTGSLKFLNSVELRQIVNN